MKKALVLILVMACGGGSKKEPATPVTTTPVETPPVTEAKTETKTETKQEAKVEVPPKIMLGDAKIVMAMKSKTDSMNGEITLAADGTISAVMTMTKKGKKSEKKTTGKLTADGELFDDKNEVIAKIGDDGAVTTRLVIETKENGKVVKSDTKWEDIGTFDGAVFTAKKDSKKYEIDDKGKLTNWPEKDGTITITSGAEQKRAAVFMVIAMFTASKITSDGSGPTSAAPVPAKK